MIRLDLHRQVFNKEKFESTVDTNFTQLIQPVEEIQEISIEEKLNTFFKMYDELFYDIPKEGETGSHRYLVVTSENYIGTKVSDQIKELMDEIVSIRTELLKANTENIDLNIKLATKSVQ